MRNLLLIIVAILILSCNSDMKKEVQLPIYPEAPSNPVTENYFGTDITDDYRNLETLTDTLTANWFKAESEFANEILDQISGRNELIDKMLDYNGRKLYDSWYYRITEDDQYFFLKEEATEGVPKLYYRKNYGAQDELIFDSKDFKPEKEKEYRINYIMPSSDGAYIAVALSYDGAEISEMVIIDMKTRKTLPAIIGHCWPADGDGVSWLPDNTGFIYLHHPIIDPNSDQFLKNMKSVVYKLGNDPEELNVIFSKETQPELQLLEEDFPSAHLAGDKSKYMIGRVGGATAYNDAYYANIADLETKKIIWRPLYKKTDKIVHGTLKGDSYIYISAKNAATYQILIGSVNDGVNPDTDDILVDSQKNEVINDFEITSDGFYFSTTKNGVEGLLYCLREGKTVPIKLPRASGRVNIISKNQNHPDLWVSTMGWVNDYIRYKYNPITNSFEEQLITENGSYPEFENFEVKEITVLSHDGKEIPLSIIHKKDLKLDNTNPTFIYGYGSYGISIRPFYYPTWLTWVEEGGVLCIAHVRGGGEKGDSWYQEGKKENKPNTWKDLISCTEYLIDKGYTSNKKTVINGESAGGILIGRAMTDRPDLFAVAIAEVGVMNAVRSEIGPNGPNNIKEFGTVKDSLGFLSLLEMDAYLNLKDDILYPATLITTGMNDPRVTPWQPGKFAAKLQNNTSTEKPILFSVNYKSGHGIGDSKKDQFKNQANVFAFALWQTGSSKYSLRTISKKE